MVLSQSALRPAQAAELPLHEQALRCEGHLIAQNIETGARQFVSERLDGEQRIALAALAFVEAPRGRQVADGEVSRFHERPSKIGIAVLTICLAFLLRVTEPLAIHTAAVGSELADTGKALNIPNLQRDREGQDRTDARDGFEHLEPRGQTDALQ